MRVESLLTLLRWCSLFRPSPLLNAIAGAFSNSAIRPAAARHSSLEQNGIQYTDTVPLGVILVVQQHQSFKGDLMFTAKCHLFTSKKSLMMEWLNIVCLVELLRMGTAGIMSSELAVLAKD